MSIISTKINYKEKWNEEFEDKIKKENICFPSSYEDFILLHNENFSELFERCGLIDGKVKIQAKDGEIKIKRIDK